MKVIVAGYSKTGTKSVHSALKHLGFTVCDHLENFWYFEKEWEKILSQGGTTEDFKQMYERFDVVIDSPAYFFWKEIHSAFPNAKIILLDREEKDWFKSIANHFSIQNKLKLLLLARILSKTGRRYFKFLRNLRVVLFGYYPKSPWDNMINEMVMKRNFRQHNADVIQNAPTDNFLLYSVKEGWKPLCKFLQKPIPKRRFPHENVGGAVFRDWSVSHPAMRQMIKETWISLGVLAAIGVFVLSAIIVLL